MRRFSYASSTALPGFPEGEGQQRRCRRRSYVFGCSIVQLIKLTSFRGTIRARIVLAGISDASLQRKSAAFAMMASSISVENVEHLTSRHTGGIDVQLTVGWACDAKQ